MSRPEAVPWTDEERQRLRQMHENGLPQAQIAVLLGRSGHAVSRQVHYLGLKRPLPKTPRVPREEPPQRAGKSTLPPLPSLRGPDEPR